MRPAASPTVGYVLRDTIGGGMKHLSHLSLGVCTSFGLLLAACSGADSDSTAAATHAEEPAVTIEYIGHASFVIDSPEGDRVLIDPYASRVWLGYDFPEGVTADGVLVTHPHYDHDAGVFRGADFPWPDLTPISEPGNHTVGSINVLGVEGKHADPYGKEFGQLNTIFVIETGGIRIAHLGDNGPLTAANVSQMGDIDILMIPGDAVYHILSPEDTQAAIAALNPRVVIPMHYRIDALETSADSPSDLGGVEPWLEGRGIITRVGSNVATLRRSDLPTQQTYLVFEHSPAIPAPSLREP